MEKKSKKQQKFASRRENKGNKMEEEKKIKTIEKQKNKIDRATGKG